MPTNFDIEKLRAEHNCFNWFETGLWDARYDDVTAKKALKCGFTKLYGVEIRTDLCEYAKVEYGDYISTGRYNLINDDSANMAKHLKDDAFKEKTMFFLDAHIDNPLISTLGIVPYKKKCPLFEELNAIDELERKDNIILVDDLRIVNGNMEEWDGITQDKQNNLELIKERVLQINSNYKFDTLDGYVPNDILLCYI